MGKQYVLETNQPCVLPPWIGPRWPLPRSGVQGHSFVSPSRVTGGWTPGGGHLGAEAGLGSATAQPQAGRPGRPRAGPRRPCLQRRTPFPFLALFPSPVMACTHTHTRVCHSAPPVCSSAGPSSVPAFRAGPPGNRPAARRAARSHCFPSCADGRGVSPDESAKREDLDVPASEAVTWWSAVRQLAGRAGLRRVSRSSRGVSVGLTAQVLGSAACARTSVLWYH